MSGTLMAAEMREQPVVLQRLLDTGAGIAATVREAVPDPLHCISLVARGSSDHAALFGRYLLEMAARRPAALAAPSLQTLYGAEIDGLGMLAIAISQSGRTPEIVTVVQRLRAQGAHTMAIVNHRDSPLARTADSVITLDAGDERAIPATKTFTATLFALELVAHCLGPVPWSDDDLLRVPHAAESVLADDSAAARVAHRLRYANRVLVLGRGLLMSAAAETALKIRETSSVFAEALSTADLRHGPIAAVTPDVPVVALSAAGPAAADVAEMVAALRARNVEVVEVSSDAASDLPLPRDLPEALQVITASIRGQQLARSMAIDRELDPDAPSGLTKVTLTH